MMNDVGYERLIDIDGTATVLPVGTVCWCAGVLVTLVCEELTLPTSELLAYFTILISIRFFLDFY